MDPLDYQREKEGEPPRVKPDFKNDKAFAFMNSATGMLIVGAAITGFGGAVIISAGQSSDVAFSFFTFFTGVAFLIGGVIKLFIEAFKKKKKGG
ncbi:MAG TPA: hypothetical protein VFE50_07505 [Cyclobacteriaceae bacterium]|nr:hypothetical protein [Cyclobacteriaceae bacterium]